MNAANAALLDEFCDTVWLEDGLSKNTLESYRRDLRQLADWLEGQDRESLLAAAEADLSGYFASRYAAGARRGVEGADRPAEQWPDGRGERRGASRGERRARRKPEQPALPTDGSQKQDSPVAAEPWTPGVDRLATTLLLGVCLVRSRDARTRIVRRALREVRL